MATYLRIAVISATGVIVALMLQLTLLARLGLPGATPDLVVVVVVALALGYGPGIGGIAGFVAGLAVDIAPPAEGVVGLNALIYLVIGWVAGSIIDVRDRTVLLLLALTSFSAGAAALLVAVLEAALGSDGVVWDLVPGIVLSSMLYALVLAPVVLPVTGMVIRKLTPEAVLTRAP